MCGVERAEFMLLDVILHCDFPAVGTAKVHDHFVVQRKSVRLGLTMVETSSLFGRTGSCMPFYY